MIIHFISSLYTVLLSLEQFVLGGGFGLRGEKFDQGKRYMIIFEQ